MTKPTNFTGNCPIREHTADGDYIGRCDFATYSDYCPRHGLVTKYPNLDDRDIPREEREFDPREAGRRVVRKFADALKRLAE